MRKPPPFIVAWLAGVGYTGRLATSERMGAAARGALGDEAFAAALAEGAAMDLDQAVAYASDEAHPI